VPLIPKRRIDNFDPLLRDLASFGLVVRVENASSGDSWKLTDEAQQRLDQLLEHHTESVVPEKLIYFDHLCADCRTRAPTRLADGVYLCASCLSQRRGTSESAPTSSAS
jgi:hypothetical protein